MDLGDQTDRVKFMIRDRGPDFTTAFDAILAGAGIWTVLCNVRAPRMNAIAERWIGGCRREFLDRTFIRDQAYLRRVLRRYETHRNQHWPHRSLHAAAPLKPLPEPINLAWYRVRNRLVSVA
jgi:putative transposase